MENFKMARKPKKVETMELTEIEMGNLAFIVEQHDGGAVTYANDDYFANLVDKGFVEINKEVVDGSGNYAGRPTEAGIKLIKDNAVNDVVAPVVTASFAIEDGVAIPEAKRGGGGGRKGPRGSKYPFATMENGQSFFVPATEDMPNPAKTLASTASTAKKAFGTVTGTREITRKGETKTVDAYTYTRGFVVRAVEENGVKGARVWRDDSQANKSED
jgi:hypothetical protein